MAELTFEIWEDQTSGQHEMSKVSHQSDKVRAATMPGATRVHSFTAASDYEAFQKNHDWNGFEDWKPVPDLAEWFFTDEEAEEQRRYMIERNI